MAFTIIQNGDPEDADVLMANFTNVNYGNQLRPVNSAGAAVDNAIALGSSTARFSGTHTNGINSGDGSSFGLKWARFSLGTKDIVSNLSNQTIMFTVNISSITNVTSRFFRLTLIGNDGIVVDGLAITHYSNNSGIGDFSYPAFDIRPNGSGSVIINQFLYVGGVYDSISSYFQTNFSNWDNTASNNRGFLDMYYTNQ